MVCKATCTAIAMIWIICISLLISVLIFGWIDDVYGSGYATLSFLLLIPSNITCIAITMYSTDKILDKFVKD